MTSKRILALFLCVVIFGGVLVSCKNKKGDSSLSAPKESVGQEGKNNDETKTETEDTSWVTGLPVDEDGKSSGGEFDNTGGTKPSKGKDDGIISVNNDKDKNKDDNDVPYDKNYNPIDEFGVSSIQDKKDIEYEYEMDNYKYAIKKDKTEVIAYKDENGVLVDMLAGAGQFQLLNKQRAVELVTGKVKSYMTRTNDNHTAIEVEYEPIGENLKVASIKTTYTFYETSIAMKCFIQYENKKITLSKDFSQFNRHFMNGSESCDKRLADKWIYPSDEDWPYKDFAGIATINNIGSRYQMLTLLTNNGNNTFALETYPETSLPLHFEESSGLYYSLSYNLTFADRSKHKDSDYRALFASQGKQFATRITPVKKSSDNSTLFIGKSTELNINVTNLTSKDLKFSIRYDIRDYYGNVIESNIFLNSTVFKNLDANRIIKINPGKYGIFYINLAIVSQSSTHKSSYREMYSFALLKDHTFKNNAKSPFGISAIPTGERYDMDAQISIAKKLGIANTRMGIEPVAFQENKEHNLAAAKKFKENNIIMNGMNLYWTQPTDPTAYQKITEESLQLFAPYLDSCEIGNEDNMPVNSGEMSLTDAFEAYKKNVFEPGYKAISKTNIPYIIAANAGNDPLWDEQVYKAGLWDKFDILSTHPYGHPYSPDLDVEAFWHMESALKRTDKILEKYGKKRIFITEIGWPTIPGTKRAADIRTQGDYLIRSYIMGLDHNAEKIQWYCFYDLFSFEAGFDQEDMEFHFGTLYFPNYFGTVMPKPSGIAFANMTRILDTVKDVTRDKDPSKESRAYTATLANNSKVTIAWSNAHRLAFDSLSSKALRDPTLPWKNQWKGSEEVKFAASGTVTVTDSMGNETKYKPSGKYVTIPLTGSPVFITGVK